VQDALHEALHYIADGGRLWEVSNAEGLGRDRRGGTGRARPP
jgi:hypothetical protein